MEKRLGNFIATAFLAFLVFGISVWILRFIYNEAFLPILSGLQELNIKESGSWSMVNVLVLLLLFLMIIGFIYLATAINKAKRTSKNLEGDRVKLGQALKEVEGTAEKLQKAQEDFERIQNLHRNP